jgi:hypothetical protein
MLPTAKLSGPAKANAFCLANLQIHAAKASRLLQFGLLRIEVVQSEFGMRWS